MSKYKGRVSRLLGIGVRAALYIRGDRSKRKDDNTWYLFRTVIMPWPSRITRAFATVEGADDIIIVDRYSGPYNALFHTPLPPEADFMLSPNYIWDV